jgi:hypothetical protein
VRHLHPLCHCEPTHDWRGNPFLLPPFLKGDCFICHYPAGNPGECMDMLGEYSASKGMRNSSIAIVKKKMRPHCF